MANSLTGLAAAARAQNAKFLEFLREPENGNTDEVEHSDGPHQPERLSPADAVAALMLARSLEGAPSFTQELYEGVGVLVLEAPAAAWVSPLAKALRRHMNDHIATAEIEMAGQDEEAVPGDAALRHIGYADDRWLFLELTKAQDTGPTYRNENTERQVLEAISDGKGVAVVASPRIALPEILRIGADHRVAAPWPNGAMLSDAAEVSFGTRPIAIVPDTLARLLFEEDLRFASRYGEDAERWIERLERLARGKVVATDGPTLDDLHGMDEAVAWGRDLAKDLADYSAGTLGWEEVDKGCMLVGPPGTGKTSYAKRLAATLRLPLVIGSYGAWQSAGHQGHMLKAMEETFNRARTLAPSILFIDEIDSMPDRSMLEGRNKEYMTQVVNRFLELVDGSSREGVVIVAAGNSSNVDPALVRPGRLDRMIHIEHPNQMALAGILREHLGNHLADVDLHDVAAMGLGGTGADAEFWIRNARRMARRAGRPMVLQDLVEQLPHPSDRPMHEQRRIAIHEAGHSVVAALETPGEMKMVALRQGGGGVLCDPCPLPTADMIEAQVRIGLAGRAAEDILLGSVSAGAGGSPHSDLARVTCLVAAMIGSQGLGAGLTWKGDINPQTVASILHRDRTLAAQVDAVLADQYRQVQELLRVNRPALEAVADQLLDRSTLTGDEVEEIVASLAADREVV